MHVRRPARSHLWTSPTTARHGSAVRRTTEDYLASASESAIRPTPSYIIYQPVLAERDRLTVFPSEGSTEHALQVELVGEALPVEHCEELIGNDQAIIHQPYKHLSILDVIGERLAFEGG